MTTQEAIWRIKTHNEIHSKKEPFAIHITEALQMAIEALDKQTPKKPGKLTDIFLIREGWTYECPTCYCACGVNKNHPDVTSDEFYCTQCGQNLNWN